MKVKVPRLLEDRLYLLRESTTGTFSDVLLARPTSLTGIVDEGPFLDGPVTPRVAVVDLDAATGALRPGSVFQPARGRVDGRYELDDALLDPDVDPLALEDVHFVQQSVFSTVYRTIGLFDEHCGRRIPWAFGREQLLVVPRAGVMENAFYERESGSLQFFEAPVASAGDAPPRTVLTALSSDIVAHETGHALLDGIAPDLYSAAEPQSLAMHEAVADLTAMFLTLTEDVVVWSVANISSSSLDLYEVLARLAEEFGHDLRRGSEFLRSAENECVFPVRVVDRETPESAVVDPHEPHAASQVLTGAVYRAFRRHAEGLRGEIDRRVRVAATDLARLLLPALDLLPPGEAAFSDLGRAVLAWASVRQAGRGTPGKLARWIAEELARRGVVEDPGRLAPDPPPAVRGRAAGDADGFAGRWRDALGVPRGAEIETSLVERAPARPGTSPLEILRIAWDEREAHDPGAGLAGRWRVRTGVTLVIDVESERPLAWIAPVDRKAGRDRRAVRLRRWAAAGLLSASDQGGAAIVARRTRSGLRLEGSGRTLHIAD